MDRLHPAIAARAAATAPYSLSRHASSDCKTRPRSKDPLFSISKSGPLSLGSPRILREQKLPTGKQAFAALPCACAAGFAEASAVCV